MLELRSTTDHGVLPVVYVDAIQQTSRLVYCPVVVCLSSLDRVVNTMVSGASSCRELSIESGFNFQGIAESARESQIVPCIGVDGIVSRAR